MLNLLIENVESVKQTIKYRILNRIYDVTYEQYLNFVNTNVFGTLYFVPEHFRTDEMCQAAVKNSAWDVGLIPEHIINEKYCAIAVSKIGCSLEYVPLKFRTKQICQIAVSTDGRALKYVPEKLKNQLMHDIANKVIRIEFYNSEWLT